MYEHKLKLGRRRVNTLLIGGAQVRISRMSRGRLLIIAEEPISEVGAPAPPKQDPAPQIEDRPKQDPAPQIENRTNAELRQHLEEMGVTPPSRATKAELLALLEGDG